MDSRPSRSSPHPSHAKRWLFRGVTAALLVLLLESLVRVAVFVMPSLALALERTRTAISVPDAELNSRPNPALPDIDRFGFRNAPGPPTTEIVALGDLADVRVRDYD